MASLRSCKKASWQAVALPASRHTAPPAWDALRAFLSPGRRRILPYSIQYLKRWRLAWFREDLSALFDLLRDKKIKPMIADRIPLSEARRAQELIGEGSMKGKLVLVCDGDRGPRSGREMG